MRAAEIDNSLLEVARRFRPRILAERDHIEASCRLPEDLARELAHAGFFRIFLPKAYGGLDLTPMEAVEVYEELARADASVAWCVWNGNTHWTAAQLSPEAARTIHANPDVITTNGHFGLMTILHPVAGWLATAAEAVSAMMAATGEDKGGLRHAQGLGTP